MEEAYMGNLRGTRRVTFAGLLIFALLVLSNRGFSQGPIAIDSMVARWARQDLLKGASVGVEIRDAASGERLGSWNADASLTPASTLKVVTTATALEVLGPDFRFRTRLAYTGTLRNDSLFGDLLLIGGGDPALGSAYFSDQAREKHFLDNWIDSLKMHKIRYISGNLVTDASVFDDQSVPDTWIWEDLGNYFGAGVSGLSVYDNSFAIHFSSPSAADQPTKIISIHPEMPELKFENKVLSSDDRRDLACVYGSPFDGNRVIRGTIPKGRKDFMIRASLPDPAKLLATQFLQKLTEAGIGIDGSIRQSPEGAKGSVLLATTWSPTLSELIRVTNHESVNLFAEHLFRQIALSETGRATNADGIEIVTAFWKKQGIDTRGFFICDGSGLSRCNAVTGKQIAEILLYMKNKSRHNELFFQSLPAVPDGTLYSFSAENFPNKCLRAKSGSMTRVRCYTGLLKTLSGRQILFSVALNNFSCTQAHAIDAIEQLLSEIVRL